MNKKKLKDQAEFKKVFHTFDMVDPFVLCEGREQGPSNPPGDMHFAPQILLVLSGALEMHYGNFKVTCRAGEFCLTGPWEPHRARILPGSCRYLVVDLDMALIGSVAPFQDVDWIYPFLSPQKEHPYFSSRKERAAVLHAARRMLWAQKKKIQGYRSYQWLEIHRLLWHIQARLPKRPHIGMLQKIYPAIVLVRKEITRPVMVEEAAQVCGLSRSRFSDLFRQETNMAFSDFALRIRINAAAVAMTGYQSASPMKQIAANFGFSDVSHFYRSFRRILDCTPYEFIQKRDCLASR